MQGERSNFYNIRIEMPKEVTGPLCYPSLIPIFSAFKEDVVLGWAEIEKRGDQCFAHGQVPTPLRGSLISGKLWLSPTIIKQHNIQTMRALSLVGGRLEDAKREHDNDNM